MRALRIDVERLARTDTQMRINTTREPIEIVERNERLHRAADMLLRGDLSVTEISERTGFGSTSYFSKCFQKEFGCKPSEYTGA